MSATEGMPMSDYLALPAVSASILRRCVDECPRAAWFDSWLNPKRIAESSEEMDAGTIAHSILLEGDAGNVAVIDPQNYPAEKTGAIPEGWTNKAIRAARDDARAAGRIPVLKRDMLAIEAMVASARAYVESLHESEPAIWAMFQPGGGDSELTIQWQDGGIPCRIRPDRISKDRKLIVDLKTTAMSANPAQWKADFFGAAFYRRSCKAEFGTEPAYTFLVLERNPPYLCSLVGIDPHGFYLGEQKVEMALGLWDRCVERQQWPGYPARVAYPEIASWVDTQWEERKAGIEYDYQTMWGAA